MYGTVLYKKKHEGFTKVAKKVLKKFSVCQIEQDNWKSFQLSVNTKYGVSYLSISTTKMIRFTLAKIFVLNFYLSVSLPDVSVTTY